MTQQFAVLDPATGQYTKFDTAEAALDAGAQIAANFYLAQTHGRPFAVIEVAENGAETWAAPDGTPMMSPEQIAADAAARIRHLESFTNAGTIPVTNL